MLSNIRISHVYFALATLSVFRVGVVIFALTALSACGGGGTGGTGAADNGGMGGTGVSTGVMTKGSVIVNGVRYEDSTANIVIDDTPKTALNLQDGMVVSVSGTVDGSGSNGTALEVRGQIEVRGLVTDVPPSVNPQRFVVFGQTVLVDDLTVYSNITFGDITQNVTIVEVHGLRDSAGNIRATRVEGSFVEQLDGSGMSNPLIDEIRGVVSNRVDSNDNLFDVSGQAVNAVGAVIVGGSFGNDSVVEVHCTRSTGCLVNGAFQASLIEVEDGNNLPGQGQRFEVEGLISDFSGHPGNFQVAGVPVSTSTSTTFKGGVADDLIDDVKIEAEGTLNGTVLVASKIEFKRSVVRLQGTVTSSSSSAFTLNIAGRSVNVEIDGFTDADAPLPLNGSAICVQVRGQRKASVAVVVTAGQIRVDGCGNSDRPVLQAPVEAETPEIFITLLGFSIDVSNPTDTPDKWVNAAGAGISRTEFFNAVVPATLGPPSVAGTLVKIIFEDAPSTSVHQVELED